MMQQSWRMKRVAPSRSVSSHPLKMTIKGVGKNKELVETIFHFFAVLLVSLKSQQQRAELPQESVNGPVNSIQEEGLKSETQVKADEKAREKACYEEARVDSEEIPEREGNAAEPMESLDNTPQAQAGDRWLRIEDRGGGRGAAGLRSVRTRTHGLE